MSLTDPRLLGKHGKGRTVLKVLTKGLHFAFRLKWFVEHMPGLSQKDGREGSCPCMGMVAHRVMDYCTTGNNVLSHLGKLLSRLGDFEIH